MWKKGMVAFACAMLVGGVAGWGVAGKREPAERQTISRSARLSGRPKPTLDDFIQSARERAERRRDPGYLPLSDELADWSNDEIRSALEAGLVHPENLIEYGKGRGIVNSLLHEWMRRDFDAVLAWYEALQSPSAKNRLTTELASGWPADKAGQGLDFILAHRALFPDSKGWAVINRNLEQRAIGGPAEVEDLLRLIREEKLRFANSASIDFPKGFDFPTLMESEEFILFKERDGAGSVMNAWFAADREKAFDWLLENEGVKSLKVLSDIRFSQDKDMQLWLAGKVGQMDPAKQGEFLEAFSSRWVESPSSMALFAKGIHDQALRDQLGLISVQSVFAGNAHEAMPLLEILGEPARRIGILEQAEPNASIFNDSSDYRFDAADEAFVRKQLAGWQATELQIESIISRFRK
jgi:hypothetical protein